MEFTNTWQPGPRCRGRPTSLQEAEAVAGLAADVSFNLTVIFMWDSVALQLFEFGAKCQIARPIYELLLSATLFVLAAEA